MADEKLNVSPEENPQPSLFDTGPAGAPAQDAPTPEPPAPENAPEQTGGEPPAQDAPAGAPGEVSVSADQIEKLMAEQRAAGRAEVEKNEPTEPEQPPTPAPEDKAPGEKEPNKKGKTTGEKAPEPEKPKGRRGRKPKEEKAGPGEPGGTGARRGRPAKADKAATDKPPSPPRDKMSQGKGGKAAAVKGKEEAPAAPQFAEKWRKQYPSCVKSWEDHWDVLTTFYEYPPEIRKIIYTTNIIEGLNRQFWQITKNTPSLTSDDSLCRLLYLASQRIVKHWHARRQNWDLALSQLEILFAGQTCG